MQWTHYQCLKKKYLRPGGSPLICSIRTGDPHFDPLHPTRRPTFDLLHDVGEVAVDLVVLGDPQREVVLLRRPERLGRVDAALIQDRVDAEICRRHGVTK